MAAALVCIDNVLRMEAVYEHRLNGLIAYGEKQAREQRLPAQLFAVAEGLTLWTVPSIGLYLLGMGIARLKQRAERPSFRATEQAVAPDVFRWPDRTRRKRR